MEPSPAGEPGTVNSRVARRPGHDLGSKNRESGSPSRKGIRLHSERAST